MLGLITVLSEETAPASTTTMEAILTALTTALTSTASSVMGAIGSVLPIVLPIAGGILAVSVGVKMFKRFAK